MFGVIEFGGAAGFLAEDVVNVAEGLLEHEWWDVSEGGWRIGGGCVHGMSRKRHLPTDW